MATKNIVPRTGSQGQLGTESKPWKAIHADTGSLSLVSGSVVPHSDDTYDLGSSSLRWRDIYTNDLHLSNKDSTNSIDNTWGDYTIQEGESDLFLINNRNGKKYKFNLTEVT